MVGLLANGRMAVPPRGLALFDEGNFDPTFVNEGESVSARKAEEIYAERGEIRVRNDVGTSVLDFQSFLQKAGHSRAKRQEVLSRIPPEACTSQNHALMRINTQSYKEWQEEFPDQVECSYSIQCASRSTE